jgi:anti-anti-sigma factor
MKISIKEEKATTILAVSESVMQEDVQQFYEAIDGLIANSKTSIVLDLKHTTYITSMGLAAILAAKKKMTSIHGDIKIACPNELVSKVLSATRIMERINVYSTIDDAILAFQREFTAP